MDAAAVSLRRWLRRQLRQPTQPLPATTTTSTTIPPILSGAADRLP